MRLFAIAPLMLLFACGDEGSATVCGARSYACGDACCQDGTESCLRTITRDEVTDECVPLLPNCTSCPCVDVPQGCNCSEVSQRVYVECDR